MFTIARSVSSAVFIVAFIFTIPVAHAVLNDTGQALCFNGTGLVACSDTITGSLSHQDGFLGRDAANAAGVLNKTGDGVAGFDFTRICNSGEVEGVGDCPNGLTASNIGDGSNDWACTRDNVTGLIWEMKTGDNGLRGSAHTYTWYDGATGHQGNTTSCAGLPIGSCNTLNYTVAVNDANLCGYADWRLPTTEELLDLVDYGVARSGATIAAIDNDYFPNTRFGNELSNEYYWSGEEQSSSNAWRVNYGAGWSVSNRKGALFPVRLVRGETRTTNFTDNGDGTVVTDHATGLMWMQCSIGQSGANCTGTATGMNWQAALQEVDDANTAAQFGYTDWRLPNIKELQTLLKRDESGMLINGTAFPNTLVTSPWYWSSTPSASGSSNAWIVNFSAGNTTAVDMSGTDYVVRLVRGGESFDLLRPTVLRLDADGVLAAGTNYNVDFSAAIHEGEGAVDSGYWVVVKAGAAEPNTVGILNGCSAISADCVASNTTSPTLGTDSFTASNLPAGAYVLHYVASSSGNHSSPHALTFYVGDTVPPVGAGGAGIASVRNNENCRFDGSSTGFIDGSGETIELPQGMFEFKLEKCGWETVRIVIDWPESIQGADYYKKVGNNWEIMPTSSSSDGFVTVTGKRAVLMLWDDGRYDADPTRGVIVDPSGPGAPPRAGGGVSVPLLPLPLVVVLAALVGIVGFRYQRTGIRNQ
jgi:Protein of unknown function (DUF1566).